MRFLLFFVLCLLLNALSAQDSLYVYARSGLTLRAAGSMAAEKLGVIPFGAVVKLTGVYTDIVEVQALPATTYDWNWQAGGEAQSLPYVMRECYREVEYNGLRGFVYGGYLGRYPVIKEETPNDPSTGWLRAQASILDTLIDGRSVYHEYRLLIGAGDISYREQLIGGGTSETIVLPSGTLNEGFLVANSLYRLERDASYREIPSTELDADVEVLVEATENKLLFQGSNGVVRIEKVGDMIVIYMDWSC